MIQYIFQSLKFNLDINKITRSCIIFGGINTENNTENEEDDLLEQTSLMEDKKLKEDTKISDTQLVRKQEVNLENLKPKMPQIVIQSIQILLSSLCAALAESSIFKLIVYKDESWGSLFLRFLVFSFIQYFLITVMSYIIDDKYGTIGSIANTVIVAASMILYILFLDPLIFGKLPEGAGVFKTITAIGLCLLTVGLFDYCINLLITSLFYSK